MSRRVSEPSVTYSAAGATEKCDLRFWQEVQELSGMKLERCYQCYMCTAGCPVAFAMDFPPHQIVRMVQMGLKERVLSSSTIWICAACETCATRCPNEVEIVKVMDVLREMARNEGVKVKEPEIQAAHRTFLSVVKYLGRQHEISLLALLKMRSGHLFKDMVLGMKMFFRGKLKLTPYRIKGVKEIREIYRSCGL